LNFAEGRRMAGILDLADDIVFVERRREPRIIVSIAAHYVLANRRDSHGNRREFACRIVDISSQAMTLLVPVNGALGERVMVHSEEFGKLEGGIIRLLDRGFIMQIALSDEGRKNFAVKIDWYEKNKNHELDDNREHKRIIPKNPHSKLVLQDGSVLQCFVIDMSVSGVAVSADVKPEIGTPLDVGSLVGRVVRHLKDGFAVKFLTLQERENLEQLLLLS
jgi:hypothetical protein